jgi:hypothetical protein
MRKQRQLRTELGSALWRWRSETSESPNSITGITRVNGVMPSPDAALELAADAMHRSKILLYWHLTQAAEGRLERVCSKTERKDAEFY